MANSLNRRAARSRAARSQKGYLGRAYAKAKRRTHTRGTFNAKLSAQIRAKEKRAKLGIYPDAPSYSQLKPRFRKIGEQLAQRVVGTDDLELKSGQDYSKNSLTTLENLLKKAEDSPDFHQKFGTKYREIQSGQDELVSTASVREMMIGARTWIKNNNPLDPTAQDRKCEQLAAVFEVLSMVRFPTVWTGYSVSDGVMQHPTSAEGGIFADGLTGPHNRLDRARAAAVADECESELRNPNATAHDIVKAAIRAATGFTLNEFVAPAAAKNVFTFSRAMTPQEASQQTQNRDLLKKIHVKADGSQDAGQDTSEDRMKEISHLSMGNARPQGHRRAVSQSRIPTLVSKLTTVSVA